MTTWWLAIDRQYTSYDELKHRKVIAQGWSALGNLLTLCPLVQAGERQSFSAVIDALGRIVYGNSTHAARVMWDLFNMRAGDIVVGIEGTVVKGICELRVNGWKSYRYDSPEAYEYAQTIGFPVRWVDWNPQTFGAAPTTPAHSVQGVAGLQNESQRIVAAWKKYKSSQ